MRIITIKKTGYATTTFYIQDNGTIYCDNSAMGFWKRDDLTLSALNAHINNMRAEGFRVTTKEAWEV